MADEDGKTFTAEEVEAMVADRNAALEAKRDELLTEVRGFKSKLKGFDGVDPTEYRQMQADLAELRQEHEAGKAGITSDQLKTMRAEVEADLTKRFSAMSAEDLAAKLPAVAGLRQDNRGLRLDSVVKAEMARAGVRAERIDALFKLSADEFALTDDGQPMLKNKPGQEVAKFVAEDLKGQYPELYMSSGSSGGGASRSDAGGVGGFTKTIAADDPDAFMSNVEKIATGEIEVEVPAG